MSLTVSRKPQHDIAPPLVIGLSRCHKMSQGNGVRGESDFDRIVKQLREPRHSRTTCDDKIPEANHQLHGLGIWKVVKRDRQGGELDVPEGFEVPVPLLEGLVLRCLIECSCDGSQLHRKGSGNFGGGLHQRESSFPLASQGAEPGRTNLPPGDHARHQDRNHAAPRLNPGCARPCLEPDVHEHARLPDVVCHLHLHHLELPVCRAHHVAVNQGARRGNLARADRREKSSLRRLACPSRCRRDVSGHHVAGAAICEELPLRLTEALPDQLEALLDAAGDLGSSVQIKKCFPVLSYQRKTFVHGMLAVFQVNNATTLLLGRLRVCQCVASPEHAPDLLPGASSIVDFHTGARCDQAKLLMYWLFLNASLAKPLFAEEQRALRLAKSLNRERQCRQRSKRHPSAAINSGACYLSKSLRRVPKHRKWLVGALNRDRIGLRLGGCCRHDETSGERR